MRSISLLLDPKVIDEIDRLRGDVPRVRWIRRVINDALEEATNGSNHKISRRAQGKDRQEAR